MLAGPRLKLQLCGLDHALMHDPIPAAFITLSEAMQRTASCVSEAHVKSVRLEHQQKVQLLFAAALEEKASRVSDTHIQGVRPEIQPKVRDDEGGTAAVCEARIAKGSDEQGFSPRVSPEAQFEFDRKDIAFTKINLALQTGALSAMVRWPESGEVFRIPPNSWRFEPCYEEIIRYGVVPSHPGRGFECHAGRTVLLETLVFESWLAVEVEKWAAPNERLCREWLTQQMRASPNDKQKGKGAWFEEARNKYNVSERTFQGCWSGAIKETGSNWGQAGRPKKSSQ